MPPTPPSSQSRATLLVVALLCIVAAATSAASLAITRASWSGEKLYLSGTAPGGASVSIANAATGAVLGTAKVEDNGRWKATIEKPARVPCRVRATQGTASVERAVSGRPFELRRRDNEESHEPVHHGAGDGAREQHGGLCRDGDVLRRHHAECDRGRDVE